MAHSSDGISEPRRTAAPVPSAPTVARRSRAGTLPSDVYRGPTTKGTGKAVAASATATSGSGSVSAVPVGPASRLTTLQSGLGLINRFRSGSLTLPKIAGGAFGTNIWTPDWLDGSGRGGGGSAGQGGPSSSSSPSGVGTSTLSTSSEDHHQMTHREDNLLSLKQNRQDATSAAKEEEAIDDPLSTLNIPKHLLSPDLGQEQDSPAFSFVNDPERDSALPAASKRQPSSRFRSQSLISDGELLLMGTSATTSGSTGLAGVHTSTSLRRGPSTHTLESVQEDDISLKPSSFSTDSLGVASGRPRANTLLEGSLRQRDAERMQESDDDETGHVVVDQFLQPLQAYTSAQIESARPTSMRDRSTSPVLTRDRQPSRTMRDGLPQDGSRSLGVRHGTPTSSFTSVDTSSDRNRPTRSLWIGFPARSGAIVENDLRQFFISYGPIESVRVLYEKDCAFINFEHVEGAVRAKETIQRDLGNRLGASIVRVDFGKPEAQQHSLSQTNAANKSHTSGFDESQRVATAASSSVPPTRALWIGTLPLGLSVNDLLRVFSSFGPIESARILTHKQCGFINFERVEDAIRAKQQLHGWDFFGPEIGALRVGFAKVPPRVALVQSGDQDGGMTRKTWEEDNLSAMLASSSLRPAVPFVPTNGPLASSSARSSASVGAGHLEKEDISLRRRMSEYKELYQELGATPEEVQNYDRPLIEYRSIERPPQSVAQRAPFERRTDGAKLREIKKKMDDGEMSLEEIEDWAKEILPGIAELASDYVGNTNVQALFERCRPPVIQMMLRQIAPYLASIGCHKNGTWAAQKILEVVESPEGMALIRDSLRVYCPEMLLDQFANYVIQGCLRFGPEYNQFIFDAISDNLWEISEGRFGARAIRASLEHELVTPAQRRQVAVAVIADSVRLVNSPNGNLLNNWILDSYDLEGKYKVLGTRYLPHLVYLLTHKHGSINVVKVMAQVKEPEAAQTLIKGLVNQKEQIEEVLADHLHGVVSISRILALPAIEQSDRKIVVEVVRRVTTRLNLHRSMAYRRLIQENYQDLGDLLSEAGTNFDGPSLNRQDQMVHPVDPQQHYRVMNPSQHLSNSNGYGHESYSYMAMDPLRWSNAAMASAMIGGLQPPIYHNQEQQDRQHQHQHQHQHQQHQQYHPNYLRQDPSLQYGYPHAQYHQAERGSQRSNHH